MNYSQWCKQKLELQGQGLNFKAKDLNFKAKDLNFKAKVKDWLNFTAKEADLQHTIEHMCKYIFD